LIVELDDFWQQVLCRYAGGYLFCVQTSGNTVTCKFEIAELDWKLAKEEVEHPECQVILKDYIVAMKTVQHFVALAKKDIGGRWQSPDYIRRK